MSGPDPLYSVSNNFYLGAYQKAISEASNLTGLSDEQKTARDVLVYRAYIELGSHDMVLSEVSASSPPALRAVGLLAEAARAGSRGGDVESVAERAVAAASDPSTGSDPVVLLAAASLLVGSGREAEALTLCHAVPDLELLALSVQSCLALHRADAAARDVAAMAALDDDATLTQLAGAWVGLAQGGQAVQEAWHVLHELGDRFGWTPRLHASLAAAAMRMGRWEDAEGELLQAFEKNPKDADTLANLAAVSVHLAKPPGRYVALLRGVDADHPFLARADAAALAFDKAAAALSA